MTPITILAYLIALIVCFLVFWRVWFLRDPKVEISKENYIIAPASGKIMEIIEINQKDEMEIKKGWFGKIRTSAKEVSDSCYIVSIFMSPMDVHIQRSSLDAKVLNVKHTDGKFRFSNSFKSLALNEKTETMLENSKIGKFKIIQIAGFFVRRIENWVKPGQKLQRSDRIGRINFGSQVSIILPKKNVVLVAHKGQHIDSGKTVIGFIGKV
jgi:phosphatidylserine decarboxylase